MLHNLYLIHIVITHTMLPIFLNVINNFLANIYLSFYLISIQSTFSPFQSHFFITLKFFSWKLNDCTICKIRQIINFIIYFYILWSQLIQSLIENSRCETCTYRYLIFFYHKYCEILLWRMEIILKR